jgi:hypothetical protein
MDRAVCQSLFAERRIKPASSKRWRLNGRIFDRALRRGLVVCPQILQSLC